MKRVLIVSLSNISTDPRVLRQVECLKTEYEIYIVGYGKKIDGVTTFFPVTENTSGSSILRKLTKLIFLFCHAYTRFYLFNYRMNSNQKRFLKKTKFDLILANDFESIPLITYLLDQETKIFLDAHEYYFDEINSGLRSRLMKPYRRWVAESLGDRMVSISTVSTGIANIYSRHFENREIVLVRNTPKKSQLNFTKHDSEHIQLIHHGGAIAGRGLESLISLISLLDYRYILNLMLVQTDKSFFNKLKDQAQPFGDRVKFVSSVPTNDIVSKISTYDLGIHLIPPLSTNNKYALPNKFFEFIQAGLGIVIGPSPEMAQIVKEHSLGVVTTTFDLYDIAKKLNSLDRPQIESYRRNSSYASGLYCWEEESKVFLAQVKKMTDGVSEQ